MELVLRARRDACMEGIFVEIQSVDESVCVCWGGEVLLFGERVSEAEGTQE